MGCQLNPFYFMFLSSHTGLISFLLVMFGFYCCFGVIELLANSKKAMINRRLLTTGCTRLGH